MNYIFCCWNNTKDKKRNINMNAYVYKGMKMYLKSQKKKKKGSWWFEVRIGKRNPAIPIQNYR